MRKEVTLMAFVFLIILISSFTVSAGWWDTITGRVVEDSCTDSDGGRDIYVKGDCSDSTGLHIEDCWSVEDIEGVSEWYCHPDDKVCVVDRSYPNAYCLLGCSNGVCKSCEDSDGGDNFYTEGYRFAPNHGSGNKEEDYCILDPFIYPSGSVVSDDDKKVDECDGEKCYVIEYHCREDLADAHIGFKCPNGCKNGACSNDSLSCLDDCDLDDRICEDNKYRVCGNYDSDSCLEWGSFISCSPNQNCSGGYCINVTVPEDECNQNKFKMAFVLIALDESELTKARLSKLNEIKQYFSEDFHTATNNLGEMDTSYNVISIVDDGTLLDSYHGDENYIKEMEVTKKFYENNPDIFDFIAIYTTFETGKSQGHFSVNNNVKGIGYEIRDYSDMFGTNGKLKGTNHMGFIDNYEPDPETFRSSGLLHETGHQWCCYVGDDYGTSNSDLPILSNYKIHWHCVFNVNDFDTIQQDPMGGCYWVDNQDGTMTRKDIYPRVPKYHPITLYLMGLLNKDQVPPIKLINPEEDPPYWQWYEPINATYQYIEIEDIISKYGDRTCDNNSQIIEPSLNIDPDEETGPVVLPDEVNKIECNGCRIDNKCYPFNYRYEGEYCDIGGEFTSQLEKESPCENNFECKTNLCIDGKCLSSSLWQKFLKWLGRLFG